MIFDLDGVLTDTAELHYQSWQRLSSELGIGFDRQINERLRGVGRRESLEIVLGGSASQYSEMQKQRLADQKNAYYLAAVEQMTPASALLGVPALLADLRARGARLAVASSSRNARVVLERLALTAAFEEVVDGNDVPESKPDPRIFLAAAARLGLAPAACVVIEDAESGVQAARAAGMRVIGVGPPERVGAADQIVADMSVLQAVDIAVLAGGGV